LIAVLGAASVAAQQTAPADPQRLLASADPALAANKKLVLDCARELWQAHAVDRAPGCLTERFVEHGTDVPPGRAAYVRYLGGLPQRAVKSSVDDLATITAEGDLVVLGFRRRVPDPEQEGQTLLETWFDVFRIEDGRIAERWDYAPRDRISDRTGGGDLAPPGEDIR
jgi:predicted SnoaL-like aldol condensation-catalyzing enzyme